MGWRILDLMHLKGELGFSKRTRQLKITSFETGEINTVSFADADIIFAGVGVSLSSGVISHLVSHDVVVVICDWRGVPIAGMYPWVNTHSRVTARQRAQAKLSEPRNKNAWMRIIKAKIRGQASNLDFLERDGGDRLREIASSVKSGDADNCEALAARLYWRRVFNDRSFNRKPGMQHDILNSMLDYGYTILRGHCMRAVLAAGLIPSLGLFHRGRSNSFALADDLIEPFRPVVDLAVAESSADISVWDKSMRSYLVQATLARFNMNGDTMPTVMINFAQLYGQYIESQLKYLPVPEWMAFVKEGD